MSSMTVSPPVVKAKALNCPNCGAPVELRGFAHTLNVVCPSCHSVLDASTPLVTVVQRVQEAQRIQPEIPLGSRGKFENTTFEVIGFQVRTADEEDGDSWSEYLLFNPYKGFRYLSVFENNWNYIRVQSALPTRHGNGYTLFNRNYNPYERCMAVTTYVVGEFPWQVRVGERVQVADYIATPYMLSAEITENETVWSLCEYYEPAKIDAAFGKAKEQPLPEAKGAFPTQGARVMGTIRSAWRMWLWLMVGIAALTLIFSVISSDKEVFRQKYAFAPGTTGEPSFVTDVFELKGRPNNIRINIDTDLDNNWVYFNFALIEQDTGQGFDFGREVSYYYGTDSDGKWSEGSRRSSVTIPGVTPGRYYLRVEPEMDAKANPVNYELVVHRGVVTWTWIWLAVLFITLPPIFISWRALMSKGSPYRGS